MSTLDPSSRAVAADGFPTGALKRLADEVGVFIAALLSPGRIIDEVEQMHALHVAAKGIETTDPARAAVLRWRASRIGLR